MNTKRWTVTIFMLGILIGSLAVAAMPLIDAGKHNWAVMHDMNVNPAYIAVDYVETRLMETVVLNAYAPSIAREWYAAIWVYIQGDDATSENILTSFKVCLEGLMATWPNAQGYTIVMVVTNRVTTTEGVKTRICGSIFLSFVHIAAEQFIQDPATETLDCFYARGMFILERAPWCVPLKELLPRLANYVWPWDIPATSPATASIQCGTCK